MDIQKLESKLSRRPQSALFARLASEYLSAGRIEDAKELCSSGLKKYPEYATAYLVLAKCCQKQGDIKGALIYLKYAQNILPDSLLIKNLYTQLENQVLQEAVGVGFLPADSPDSAQTVPTKQEVEKLVEIPVAEQEIQNLGDKTELPVAEEFTVEDKISEIVTPLEISKDIQDKPPEIPSPSEVAETAEVPQPADNFLPAEPAENVKPGEEDRIVSKTLAEIFVMQGEYDEAILTYRLLVQSRPQQAEEFEKRIAELENDRRTKSSR